MTYNKVQEEWKIEVGSILDGLIDSQKDWRNTTPMGIQKEF